MRLLQGSRHVRDGSVGRHADATAGHHVRDGLLGQTILEIVGSAHPIGRGELQELAVVGGRRSGFVLLLDGPQQIGAGDHTEDTARLVHDRRSIDLLLDEQPVHVHERSLRVDGEHPGLHDVGGGLGHDSPPPTSVGSPILGDVPGHALCATGSPAPAPRLAPNLQTNRS